MRNKIANRVRRKLLRHGVVISKEYAVNLPGAKYYDAEVWYKDHLIFCMGGKDKLKCFKFIKEAVIDIDNSRIPNKNS